MAMIYCVSFDPYCVVMQVVTKCDEIVSVLFLKQMVKSCIVGINLFLDNASLIRLRPLRGRFYL